MAAAAAPAKSLEEQSIKIESKRFAAGERGQPVGTRAPLVITAEVLDGVDCEPDTGTSSSYNVKLNRGLAYPFGSKKDFSVKPGMVMIYDIRESEQGKTSMISSLRARSAYNGLTWEEAVKYYRVAGIAQGSFDSQKGSDDQTEDRAMGLVNFGDQTIVNRTSKQYFSVNSLIGFRPPSVLVESSGGSTKVIPACVAANDEPTAFRPEPYEIKPFDFVAKFQDQVFEIMDETKTSTIIEPLHGGAAIATTVANYKNLSDKLSEQFKEIAHTRGFTNIVCLVVAFISYADDFDKIGHFVANPFCFSDHSGNDEKKLHDAATWATIGNAIATGYNPVTDRTPEHRRRGLHALHITRFIAENIRDMYQQQQLNVRGVCQKDSAPGEPLDIRMM